MELPRFKVDVAGVISEEMVRQHVGEYGEQEIQIVERGDGPTGVYAAKAVMRLGAPAYDIFKRLCDPEENKRIFDRTTASVNCRNLISESKEDGTRVFEVSKTGRWKIMGIPVTFESTVTAVEDWKSLEIRFRLKNPGAMKHFSGFWRLFPVGRNEALVLVYQEAVPAFPMPKIFRSFIEKVIKTVCGSLLSDLRDSSLTWDERPVPDSSPP